MRINNLMMVYIKLVMTMMLWGGTFIAGRMLKDNVEPFSAAFIRFAIASLFLLFIVRRTEGKIQRLERTQVLPVVLLGLTGVFSYNAFFFKGLHLVSAGRASLIIATNPVFISLLSAWLFREKLNSLKIAGILLSVSGAVIVISKGHITELFSGGMGFGEILIFGCVVSWVSYSLIGKKVMAGLSPLTTVFYSTVIGAGFLFIPACVGGMIKDMLTYSPLEWFCIFYLGFFGTVLGFVWYYEGIRKIGPTKASLFINFVPVSAITLAFFILSEPVTFSLLAGAVLVAAGVYLTNSNFADRQGR